MSNQPINHVCHACQKSISIKREFSLQHAGKQFNCPHCGAPNKVPSIEVELQVDDLVDPNAISQPANDPLFGDAPLEEVYTAEVAQGAPAQMQQPRQMQQPAQRVVQQNKTAAKKPKKTLSLLRTGILLVVGLVLVGVSVPIYFYLTSEKSNDGQVDGLGGRITQNANSSSPGKLRIYWPPEARKNARVFIDSKSYEVPLTGNVEYELPDGEHRLSLQPVAGGEMDSVNFTVKKGTTFNYNLPNSFAEGGIRVTQDDVFDDWIQSYEQGKRDAKRDNKKIFMVFDCSDSNAASKTLSREVFSQTRFYNGISSEYVLLHIDFPRTAKQKAKVENAQRNEDLLKAFPVTSFPTLIFADENGQPFGLYEELELSNPIEEFFAAANVAKENKIEIRNAIVETERNIRNGEEVDDTALLELVGGRLMPFYLPTYEKWMNQAKRLDPKNVVGAYESCFQLYMRSRLMLKEPGVRDSERIRKCVTEIEKFSEEVSFKDKELGQKLFITAAGLMTRYDHNEVIRIAELGLKIKSGTEEREAQLQMLKRFDVMSTGSGFVIDYKDNVATLLTNHHVVEDAVYLVVYIADDPREYQATIVEANKKLDLAVITIEIDKPLSSVTFDNRPLQNGDAVAALGYPLGYENNVMTRGIVSSAKTQDGMVMMDCTVNPGNSGGPLFGANGLVTGIVTQKTLNNERVDSYGKAIMVSTATKFLEKVLKNDFSRVNVSQSSEVLPWSAVNQSATTSLARVVVKRPDMTQEKATELNQTIWKYVLSPKGQSPNVSNLLKDAKRLCRDYPEPMYMNTLGGLYYRMGQYDEAIKTLETSVKKNIEEEGEPLALDLVFLALSHFKLGQKPKAQIYYIQATKALADVELGIDEDSVILLKELKKEMN